eukprot:gb/GECH01006895.1/.p1 GENE.gb/GECH01006895.1/~~gb/GECH01006895.1/.p1  ORF type:complete len:771 (+),score=111.69 gb/GECH01006895.1/:1-2313(+)
MSTAKNKFQKLLFLFFLLFFFTLIYVTLFLNTEHKTTTKTKTFSNVYHENWIVTTSVNYPTQAIKKLAQLKGWKVVVVGDKATPQDWSLPNVIFLSLEDQVNLGYQIAKLLPFKSYARKNIGYLFAIEHGAQIIYETDDDNLLIRPVLSMAFDIEENVTQPTLWNSDGYEFINPYPTFGQPTMWPRGYPLSLIGKETNRNFFKYPGKISVAIQQGLADGDPDVDAIYRLTRKNIGKAIDIRFRGPMDRVVVPHGTLSPFNSQNTLFHYRAFWGMYIPSTTTFRTSDIWRGYWAQRLLWEVSSHLGFYGSSVYQDRNEHDYLKDYIDEKPLYEDALRFGQFLRSWTPSSRDFQFSDIMLSLSKDMAKQGFWRDNEIPIIRAWIQDLKNIGFQFPLRDSSSSFLLKSPDESSFKLPCNKIPPQNTSNLQCSIHENPKRYLYTRMRSGITNQRMEITMSCLIANKLDLTLIVPNVVFEKLEKSDEPKILKPFGEFFDEKTFRENLPEIRMVNESQLSEKVFQTAKESKHPKIGRFNSFNHITKIEPIRFKDDDKTPIELYKVVSPHRDFIVEESQDVLLWERAIRSLVPSTHVQSIIDSVEDKMNQLGKDWIAVHQRSGYLYQKDKFMATEPSKQVEIMIRSLHIDPWIPVYLFGAGIDEDTVSTYRNQFKTVVVADDILGSIPNMLKALVNFEVVGRSSLFISSNQRSSFDTLAYLLSSETFSGSFNSHSLVCLTYGNNVNGDFSKSIFQKIPQCTDEKFVSLVPARLKSNS